MKRLLTLALALLFCLTACQKAPEITITTPATIEMSSDGSNGTITFTANRDWTAKASEGWVHISQTSGEASKGQVTISVRCDANTTYDDRTATVTIVIDGMSQTVTIKQPANLGIILPTQSYDLQAGAKTIDVVVQANVEYTVDISAEWIKQVGTKGLTSTTYTFSIEENTTYDSREGKVTIKPKQSGVAEQVISVKQAQKDALSIEKTSYDMPYGGGEIEIKVEANVDYDVTPDSDWLHYVNTKGLNSSTVLITVDENTTYDAREGKIEISQQNGSIKHTITVRQQQTPGLSISKKEFDLTNAAQSIEIEVQKNIDYDVIIDDACKNWISKASTKALSSEKVVFNIAANTDYDNREGKITFKQSDGDLSETVVVRQGQAYGLFITTQEYNLSYESQTIEIEVKDNVPYEVVIPDEAKSWVSVQSDTQTKALAEHKVVLAIAQNNAYEDREASITIRQTNGPLSETVTIRQEWKREIITFADAQFKAFCVNNFDTNGDGEIDIKEALAIKEINVETDNIVSLSGIEHFLNLEQLVANPRHTGEYGVGIGEDWRNSGFTNDEYNGYNTVEIVRGRINSLNLSGNEKLSYLDCSGNQLIELDLSANQNLEFLYLNYNYDLSRLILGDKPQLRYLELGATSVSSIDLTSLPELYHFKMDRGEPLDGGTIDLSKNPKLCELNLDNRGLKTIDVSNNPDLEQLSISVNDLTELDIRNNTRLTDLNFAFNRVKSIDMSNSPHIRFLWFQNNEISSISLSHLHDLQTLHIGNYQKASDGSIPINTIGEVDLSGNPKLKWFACSISDIKDLDVSDKEHLVMFDCCYNELVEEIDVSSSKDLETLLCYRDPKLERIYITAEQKFSYSKDNTAHFIYKGEGAPYCSTDFSKDGTVKTLQSAKSANGIDLVLMGDAFSDRLIADGTYDAVMSQTMEAFFSVEPYKSFRDMFNVYSVTAVSVNETFAGIHETALSTKFGEGTYISGDDGAAFNYAQNVPDFDADKGVICVVLNEKAFAGTCQMYFSYTMDPEGNTQIVTKDGDGAAIAYIPLGTDDDEFAMLVHHEVGGHGFAKLADEYFYSGGGAIPQEEIDRLEMMHSMGWYTNVDTHSDKDEVLWSPFLKDTRYASQGLGVFEGAYLYEQGVYRPTDDSIMNTNRGQYNAPSRKAIYYRINKLVNGEGWEFDYEGFVSYDAVNRQGAAKAKSVRSKGRNLPPLHPPVIINKNWREVKPFPKPAKRTQTAAPVRLREMAAPNQSRQRINGMTTSPNYTYSDGLHMDGSVFKK